MDLPESAPAEDSSEDALLPELLLAAAFAQQTARGPARQHDVLKAGVQLGAYRVLRRIGSGAMGTVYSARQTHPQREVALKLLSPTHASKAMVRRFQREARLLGSLQHACIAQVYEAGSVTPEGLSIPIHYLALELVHGVSLLEWIETRKPDLNAQLELVALACDAVQHAHQRGVLHRDLKPSNVLVVEDDGGGNARPKVFDFGVARAIGEDTLESDRTQVTLEGQVVGTLAYMSPEQAQGDTLAVDTRTDVYALGAILYRLLTGQLPVAVSGLGVVEAARLIQERVPARPSTLASSVGAELDTILLKALAKSKSERYASAAELGAELRRFLRGEPILAHENSALYVLRKTVARHRWPAAGLAAGALLVFAFAIVASWQARRNQRLAQSEGASRAQLAIELRRSNLERARLFAVAGNLAAAERLSWQELVAAPESNEPLWALRELYRRYPCLRTHATSESILWSLVALPDGRLVSIGEDGVLRAYMGPDYEPRELLLRRAPGMQELRLTKDGASLVCFGTTGVLDLLNAETLERERSIAVREPGLNSFEGNGLDVTSDGRAFVALQDGRVRSFDLDSGAHLADWTGFDAPLTDLRLSPSENRLAVGGSDGTVWLVSAADGRVAWSKEGTGLEVTRMEFTPDESLLLVGGRDRRVRVYDVHGGDLQTTWDAPNGTVRQIVIEPKRGRALVAGWWSLDASGASSAPSAGCCSPFPTDCLARLSQHGILVTSGRGLVKVWEDRVVEGPDVLFQADGRTTVRIVGDGTRAAVGDGSGWLSLIDLRDGRVLHRVRSHTTRIRALAASPDGRLVLAGTQTEDLAVFDTERGAITARLGPSETMGARAISITPDGTRAAFAVDPFTIEVRLLPQGALVSRMEGIAGGINCLTWSTDGNSLFVVERPRGLRRFGPDGVLQAAGEMPNDLWAVSASPDGRVLAASSWSGAVYLLDPETLELAGRLEAHASTVWDMAFRPGAPNHLLTASGDGTVRLWDLQAERVLMLLDEFEGWEVLSADFAPDGRSVVLSGSNGWVRSLDLLAADLCIAGNAGYQLGLLAPELSESSTLATMRAALLPRLGR